MNETSETASDSMPNRDMAFFHALPLAYRGERMRRAAWPGNVFIWWLPPAMVKKEWIKDPQFKLVADEMSDTDEVECLGAFRMLDVKGRILTGWLPNAYDLHANDWEVFKR